MTQNIVFLGLDHHTRSVQWHLMNPAGKDLGHRAIPNSVEEIGQAVRQTAARHGCDPDTLRVVAALEACGGTANLAEELRRQFGWEVQLGHAGICKRMKQNPDKTDYSDAKLLADLVRIQYLPKVWLAPAPIRDLRQLMRYRCRLVKERSAAKLRIRGLLREHRISLPPESGTSWSKAWRKALAGVAKDLPAHAGWILERLIEDIARLDQAIVVAEQRVETTLADDPIVAKLRTIKGVGLITAAMLRAEVGRFDRFQSGKQLAHFCGISPKNESSGERQSTAGLILNGNSNLKSVLIEMAWRLIRYDAHWKQFAARLTEKHKPKPVIAAAVANRFMRRLYHEMKPLGLGLEVAA